MCDPVTIGAIAVSAAMSIGGTVMANSQQNKMIERGAENANKKTIFDYEQITNQSKDEQDASATEKLQRQLQTARQRGQIAVAQGDAGVGGNSSLMVMNNSIMQERADLDVLESNRSGRIRGINSTMQGIDIGATGEAANLEASAPGGMGSMLSYGAAGIQGGMSGYSMGKGLKKILPSKTGE